jgi:hypothetical protein
MNEARHEADPQTIVAFMTTEHFTLQTARASANAEINSRLQLFTTSLSGTIVTLALAAQLSGRGPVFQTFALILLPTLYFLGVMALLRILQVTDEWRIYGQGMARIRHYFLELAPQMKPYFVMPSTDDPWANLGVVGIRTAWWQGLLTSGALIVVLDSIVGGSFVGLLASIVAPQAAISLGFGVAGFLVSILLLYDAQRRIFRRHIASLPAVFPRDPKTEGQSTSRA